ncbi:MAG: LTA synthase family protein, partial [Anaerotignum sp.]|nr:LTA synthase family protein [Anaerotignum sp.]
ILYVTESLDGEYTVVGENFTKWTYVYINGEKQSRKFVNENTLKLKKSHLEEWDIVTVCQVGSSNTIFRTSEEYVYLNGRVVPYTDELKEKKLLQEHGDPAKVAAELRQQKREEKRSEIKVK